MPGPSGGPRNMIKVMLRLGDFSFSIDTAAYETLDRTTQYVWPIQDRPSKRPGRQWTGPGEETIDLPGVIYPQFKGTLNELDTLRNLAEEGEPKFLIDGRGNIWGKYCIEEIKETQKIFFSDGVPREIRFQIKLSRFGEDQ
jgi:phage protein U